MYMYIHVYGTCMYICTCIILPLFSCVHSCNLPHPAGYPSILATNILFFLPHPLHFNLFVLVCCSRDELIKQLQDDIKTAPRKEKVINLEEQVSELKTDNKRISEELRRWMNNIILRLSQWRTIHVHVVSIKLVIWLYMIVYIHVVYVHIYIIIMIVYVQLLVVTCYYSYELKYQDSQSKLDQLPTIQDMERLVLYSPLVL